MKLKNFLNLLYPDTKVIVVRDYETIPKPSDYQRHEDLPVDALSVDEKSGILYVYINSMGYYYNAKNDKYEKTTVNGDQGDN